MLFSRPYSNVYEINREIEYHRIFSHFANWGIRVIERLSEMLYSVRWLVKYKQL